MKLPLKNQPLPICVANFFAGIIKTFSIDGLAETAKLFLLLILFCTFSKIAVLAQTADFYVATTGNDSNPGTLEEPFATFNQARISADALLQKSGGRANPITVMFRGGTYFWTSTLNFTSADSGTSKLGIVYENYPGETPVFTGGEQLTGWKSEGDGKYEINLPSTTQYFEQLWYNGQRRLRPRLGSSTGNVGTYYRVASPVYVNSPETNCPVESSSGQYECFDRFHYYATDPISNKWTNLSPPSGNSCGASGNAYPSGDIELELFERWSMSKMRISCIDTTNHIIYLTGPTSANMNSLALTSQVPIANHRYLIENVENDFTQPGQWFLNRSTASWTLTYIANSGEDPNTDTVIIPQISQLIVATNLQYVTFSGLTFENDNWTIPATGYPAQQQEPYLPVAISCQNCRYITFDGGTVAQTSGGGLEFVTTDTSSTTAYNTIENSMFYDIGGMGMRIGALPYYTDTDSNVAQYTTVQNNAVEGYGRVIASSPGISQGDGHNNTYTHNEVYDGYHDGIELCAPDCLPGQSDSHGVFDNTMSFNLVYDIGQGILSDMGCIYLDAYPTSTGNQILNNKCHDVVDASVLDSDGYAGQGYYLDYDTASVLVENNLAYRVTSMAMAQTCGAQSPNTANTIRNNIFAFFQQAGKQEGCVPTASNILQFNFSNNLIYYEPNSSVQAMCAYSPSGNLHEAQIYQKNLYCYAGAADCTMPSNAFYTSDSTCANHTYYDFAGWQALGEDNGSIVADPLFVDPYYPSDNFALQSGSPASEVGFVTFDVNAPGREAGATPVPAVAATFPTDTVAGISSVSIASSVNPSTWQQAVTLTATVTSQIGPPPNGETVTFMNGGTTLTTAKLNQGVASVTISSLPVALNSITASYAGDSMWSGSTSQAYNQRVNVAVTTTTVTSSANPSNAGQEVTFTANVEAPAGKATGSVTFVANGTTVATENLVNGVAKFTTSTLRTGSTNMSAQYSGSSNYSGSSANVTQVVDHFPSTTSITSASPNPASYGKAVTFVAKVNGDSPTGSVRFYSGSTYLGKGTISAGTASYTTTGKQLAEGSDSITATYGGDQNNESSTSNAVVETVN